jgi:cell division septation protein DedD
MSDQGVREIQLNGKQLVFMFMTATVAAVVVFLCGVMVGRGVDTTRAAAATAVTTEPTVDPTSPASGLSPTSSDTSSGEPVSSQEDLKDLTYAKRLEAPEPPPEPAVEPVSPPPAFPAVAESKPTPAPVVSTAARAKEASARESNVRETIGPELSARESTEPQGNGFVVQVASLRSRREADAIAQRLSAKGFPSFVTTPGSGGPRVFRVRVGKFSDRRQAETVARRLEKEEQFKPWITR